MPDQKHHHGKVSTASADSSRANNANEYSAQASSQTPSQKNRATSSSKGSIELSNVEANRASHLQRPIVTDSTLEMEASPADVHHDMEPIHISAALDEDDDEFTSTSLSSNNNMNHSEKYITDLILDEEEWRKQLDEIQKDLSIPKHNESKGSEAVDISSSSEYVDHHDRSSKNEYLKEVQNLLVKIKHEREKTSPLRDHHFRTDSVSTSILSKMMRKNLDDDLENVIEESTRLLREELPMFSYELKSPNTLGFSELVVKSQREKRRKSPSSYGLHHTPTLSKPVNDFPFHLLEYSNYDISRGVFKDSNHRRYHFSSSHEDEDGDDLSTKFFPHLNETIQKATPSSRRRLKSNIVQTKNTGITTPDKREYYANSTEILPSNLTSNHIYETEDDNSPNNNINNFTPKSSVSSTITEQLSPITDLSPSIPLVSKPINDEVTNSSLAEAVKQDENNDKETDRFVTETVITVMQTKEDELSLIDRDSFKDDQLLACDKSIQEDHLRTDAESLPQEPLDIAEDKEDDENNDSDSISNKVDPFNDQIHHELSPKPLDEPEIVSSLETVPPEVTETLDDAQELNNEQCCSPNESTPVNDSYNITHPGEQEKQHIRELLIVSTPIITVEPSSTPHNEIVLSTPLDLVDEATSTDDNTEVTPTPQMILFEDKGTSPEKFSDENISDHDSSKKMLSHNDDRVNSETDENHEIDEEDLLNSSQDYIYDISSLSGIKLENFHNLEFLEPEGDSPIHHQVEKSKELTTARHDEDRKQDHLEEEQDRIPSCSNHYRSEKHPETSCFISESEKNNLPIKNEARNTTIPKKESPKDLNTIGFQDIIRSLNESTQSILNISHTSKDKKAATSYSTTNFATPHKTDSSIPTLLMDDTEMLLSPIFHESTHSPTLNNKYNTTTPPHGSSSVNRSSSSSPNYDNISTSSISPKRRTVTKKSNNASDNKTIPYSEVRHLQKQTYNHSTIGWYLNLCSDKYSRTPQPSEKSSSVKWV
ncbi:hypothetical protein C9374_013282 [Naegleria lovaniensis]|uniref:Uncharacterized protein n=1 Tax=Naegleria lovaniensis TaxID=51637 RepID=A0AA88H1Q3_NAELO|nr:uncharacterized protein C9374_013282 [Naegleria lovaniensis]KAG2391797.1 hypothetical protein C9374_013282 [Naegleria lovaniensis]